MSALELDRAWYMDAPDEVLGTFDTSLHGLSGKEANARLAQYGLNQIRQAEPVRPWAIFLHQFASPLIYVLLVAMVITLLIGDYTDATVIAMVLALNATIGFIQEYRAENAMQALMGLVSPRATVRRDGERYEIESRELVPGDIVLLESGDLVPADVRLVEASQFQTDDSILTGESAAVTKVSEALEDIERVSPGDLRNMAFMGTAVASGRAKAVVVATGQQTQIGLIAGEMHETVRARTPLQHRMHRFGNRVSIAIVLVSIVAFSVGLMQGVPASDMFLTAVAIAVAAIPEGLPVVMTVALAVSVRRMAKRQAIIRRLPAVETLGSCTVIVSDKTGTLTENRMTVQQLWTANQSYTITGTGLSPSGHVERDGSAVDVDAGSALSETLLAGLLANESDIRRHPEREDEDFVAHGDPTEVALLVAAAKAGLAREDLLDEFPQIDHVPFESQQQFSATVHTDRASGDAMIAYIKGAPERVLDMCESIRGDEGEESLDREAVLQQAREMAREGLRLLAMAVGRSDDAIESTRAGTNPRGLTFLGLVGMMDPPREEVIDAIDRCHAAGIRVIMCTGDHAETAGAIARKIGLSSDRSDDTTTVITGVELAEFNDQQLAGRLRDVSVFARVSPTQKLRIVNALRDLDEVVAVTGDGVNDAPALKSAHIGCAMGESGTDVAKEASELVLADDNFATIYAAVEEGRTVFANIRKATDFLLSTSVGVVIAIFGTFVLAAFGLLAIDQAEGIPLLLLPAQILWLNVVTNGIQDVALAFEPGEKHQFTRPPRDPAEGLLGPLVERTVLVGILLAIVALAMFSWELNRGSDLAYAQVATLTTMVIFNALHVGACRSDVLSIFQKNVFSNPVLFIGTSVSLAIHVSALYLPPTQFLLNFEPLRADTWLVIVVAAPSVLIFVELHKLVRKM